MDKAHDRYQLMWKAIHALVDAMVDDLNPDEQEYVREKLREEVKFWRLR